MPRPDISDKVVHFTGPSDNLEEAFCRFKSIVNGRKLIAGNEKIKGGHFCVCFSEAPLLSLPSGLVNQSNFSRYAPFGVMFDKKWLFEKGGRPVIYQADSEYSVLPSSIRWRHVRYEPIDTSQIDFTWEREWRIPCRELHFQPHEVAFIVPDIEWASRLRNEHEHDQDYDVRQYSIVFDEYIAEQYREDFPWRFIILGI